MSSSPLPTLSPPPPAASDSTSDAVVSASRKLRHAAVIAVLLIVIGTLAGVLPRMKRAAALATATRELAIQTVTVISPIAGDSSGAFLLPAEIKPLLDAPIYARASGYITRFFVDIGAQVKAGDLLAEIDTPELDEELAQARAQVDQAQAALALAKTTATRWAELVKTASVSEQESAEKHAELELKTANLAASRANVARLEDLQRFQKVTAPFDGTITARMIDVGQLITAGSTRELFRLTQTRTLRVFVHVPQSAAAGIKIGQSAELLIPELAGRAFPAKVVRTAGAMSPDSRTLLTELEVNNAEGEILAGTFAQARFSDSVIKPALTLPSNTLLFRSEGLQVGIVGENGQVELRSIKLGRDFGPTIEILGGVSTNDSVILNPPDSLVGGTTVRAAKTAVCLPPIPKP